MKYYLIAGASSGMGRETAIQLSNNETTIILVSRRRDALERVQKELIGDSIVIPCDLTNLEEIKNLFEVLSNKKIKLDGMVYCAGICFTKALKVMSEEDLENMFRINVFGFYEMCRHFQKVKVSNKGASIVGISSYAAVTREMGMSAYAMTKETMNVQAQVLAKEFLKRKIRINTVMPAYVKSKMNGDDNIWTEEEIAYAEQRQPLGLIPIASVVKVILFLMSDSAEYITGESIAMSGGYLG